MEEHPQPHLEPEDGGGQGALPLQVPASGGERETQQLLGRQEELGVQKYLAIGAEQQLLLT